RSHDVLRSLLSSIRDFLHCSRPPPPLPSFPTRRSSDLPLVPQLHRAGIGFGVDRGARRQRHRIRVGPHLDAAQTVDRGKARVRQDRKSTRLNSSHRTISYAVFCLKKKKEQKENLEN